VSSVCSAYFIVCFQNVELCSTCFEKFGHEHAVRKYVAEGKSRAAVKPGDTTSGVIQRCIETVAHAASCTQGTACPRQPECGKMMDVLRHARSCTVRSSCTVCQQLMALCVTHARSCTIEATECRVPFCAELRRHIQRRQAVQRQQQHQMDDRRRALMTGIGIINEGAKDMDAKDANHLGESSKGQQCAGKGGDEPQLPLSGGAIVTDSRSPDVTAGYSEHATASTSIVHPYDGSIAAVSSTLPAAELKTSVFPVPQLNTNSASENPSGVDSTCSSEPKTASPGIDERAVVENHASGDGSTIEVIEKTDSSARHQLVVGCLRVLKKLHPSMSKQNLLQLLCRCSRQQLTSLQDKVSCILRG